MIPEKSFAVFVSFIGLLFLSDCRSFVVCQRIMRIKRMERPEAIVTTVRPVILLVLFHFNWHHFLTTNRNLACTLKRRKSFRFSSFATFVLFVGLLFLSNCRAVPPVLCSLPTNHPNGSIQGTCHHRSTCANCNPST